MNDIELTEKIKNLKWQIDLTAGTCRSEFAHYRIIKRTGYTDLQSEWINPDLPPVEAAVNKIQQGAADALKEAQGG